MLIRNCLRLITTIALSFQFIACQPKADDTPVEPTPPPNEKRILPISTTTSTTLPHSAVTDQPVDPVFNNLADIQNHFAPTRPHYVGQLTVAQTLKLNLVEPRAQLTMGQCHDIRAKIESHAALSPFRFKWEKGEHLFPICGDEGDVQPDLAQKIYYERTSLKTNFGRSATFALLRYDPQVGDVLIGLLLDSNHRLLEGYQVILEKPHDPRSILRADIWSFDTSENYYTNSYYTNPSFSRENTQSFVTADANRMGTRVYRPSRQDSSQYVEVITIREPTTVGWKRLTIVPTATLMNPFFIYESGIRVISSNENILSTYTLNNQEVCAQGTIKRFDKYFVQSSQDPTCTDAY